MLANLLGVPVVGGREAMADAAAQHGAERLVVAIPSANVLVCAGYKWLMGPYSLGVAYYGKSFNNGIPIEENWINRKISLNEIIQSWPL